MCKYSNAQILNYISIWEYTKSDPNTDKLTKCTLHIVLHLAKALCDNQAMLLPTLSRTFLSMYVDNSSADCIVDGSVNFTSKWQMATKTGPALPSPSPKIQVCDMVPCYFQRTAIC